MNNAERIIPSDEGIHQYQSQAKESNQ